MATVHEVSQDNDRQINLLTTLEHAVEAYAWRVEDWADELGKAGA